MTLLKAKYLNALAITWLFFTSVSSDG